MWILPLKWGIALMTLIDIIIALLILLASVVAYIEEQKRLNDPEATSVLYFLIITDGIIIVLFFIKCFYGMGYTQTILCPPKKRKREGREVTES